MYIYRLILLLIFIATATICSHAQRTSGSSGLLNIPAGELWPDKTFNAGINYLPEKITSEYFDYNTANYFFNLIFLPFAEVTYRLTLLNLGDKYNQDRSLSGKLKFWKENKYYPSLVFGLDDIYTTTKGGGNQFFASTYLVSNKTVALKQHSFILTLGYGFNTQDKGRLVGFFGGINYSPKQLPELELMVEYDTQHINIAAAICLWKHLAIYGGWYGINQPAAGLSYRLILN